MRALKTILIILLVLAAIVGVLGMIGPDTFRAERSVTIAAPPEAVYPHVSSLGAMDKWSPWNALDPNMTKTTEGTDGTVGAVQRWEGNSDVGKGQQRIDSLVPNSLVKTRLKFIEPMESESDVFVELSPEGEGTKVTWAMQGENNFMSKVMSKFMDIDAMIGKDFEKGLYMLKEQVEAAEPARKAAATAYSISTVDRPEMVYVGLRDKKVKWADLDAFYGKGFGTAGAGIGAAKLEMAGPPSGVYWEWNEEDQTADLLVGFPVKGTASTKVADLGTYVVPASKALLAVHQGSYEASMAAHEALNAHIQSNGLTHHSNVIEEYIVGPSTEPDTTKWVTNIYYLIK